MNEKEVADSIEAQFARRLAGNEKKIRDKALKKLKRYMCLRSQKSDGGFSREEMLRIWKGLFYCMWMSDKPLIQEELSKNISSVMLDLKNTKTAMLFFDVFLQTMLREWMGIDRLRMDKFYLLVRNMLEVSFKFVKSKEWDVGIIDWLLSILKNGPISPVRPYSGMHYHFCDIYLEELAKVATNTISSELVMRFLDPYCIFITEAKNNDLVSMVISEIFEQLVENSKPALDLLAEEEDDELIVEIRSNTQLPQSDSSPITALTLDYNALADRIFELASEEGVLAKSKKKAFLLVEKFRELAEGRLPLSDIPDAEFSSEDELEMLEQSLTKKLVKTDVKSFADNQESKKTRRKRAKASQEVEAIEPASQVSDGEAEESNNVLENAIVEAGQIPKKKKQWNDKSVSDSTNDAVESRPKKKKSKGAKSNASKVSLDDSAIPNQTVDQKDASDRCVTDNHSLNTTATSDNMPDLIQDVAKCNRMSDVENENDAPKFETLQKWLDTGRAHTTPATRVLETSGYNIEEEKKSKVPRDTHVNVGAKEKVSMSKQKKKLKRKKVAELSALLDEESHLPQSTSDIALEPAENENVTSVPIDSAFLNFALSKVKKTKEKKRLAGVKRKQDPVKFHSPKRVAFEMSKTQIKPFRRTDKAIACSPSPATVAFDPLKRPSYGLLKTIRAKNSQRSKASDFFASV